MKCWWIGLWESITCLKTFQRDVTIDNLALKKKPNQKVTFPTFLTLPLRDAACSFMTLDSENRPWAPALLCHVCNLCSKDMRKTFCHSPRWFFFFFFLLGRFKPKLKWLQFSSSPSSKVYRKYDLFTGASRSSVRGSRCLHLGFYYLHGLGYFPP